MSYWRNIALIIVLALVLAGFWFVEDKLNPTSNSQNGCSLGSLALPDVTVETSVQPDASKLGQSSGPSLQLVVSGYYSNYTSVEANIAGSIKRSSEVYSQALRINITGPANQSVNLSLKGEPAGSYATFSPNPVKTDSSGHATATLFLYGIATSTTGSQKKSLTVVASEPNGSASITLQASVTEPYVYGVSHPGALRLGTAVESECSGGFLLYGLVFIPPDSVGSSSSFIPMSLKVVGVYDGTKVAPLPSWLNVSFQPNETILRAYTLSFITLLESNRFQAPSGSASYISTVTLAINESIAGHSYIVPVNLSLVPAFD
ncbi:MAG: hypothetical protein QW767_00585 [Thermoprotei archaeon]